MEGYKMRRLPVGYCVLVLAVGLSTASAFAEEFVFDYQKNVELDGPSRVSLELVRGKVTVTGTDDNTLVIEVSKTIRASSRHEAEEVADHIEIKVAEVKEGVSILTNYLTMLDRSKSFWQKLLGGESQNLLAVNYVIKLPLGSSIAVRSLAADLDFSNIEGAINVENTNGATRGEFIFGDISINQVSGSIDLRSVEGDIRIKATTGTIFVNQVRGAIDLSTRTGDVTIQTELDSPREYLVETASGRIDFTIPSSASGEFRIETETGKIKSEMPISIESMTRRKLVGKFGLGGPAVNLSSTSGDVVVKTY
jgi:DUF4097 and DUF4098 domain-containing protein YvlB